MEEDRSLTEIRNVAEALEWDSGGIPDEGDAAFSLLRYSVQRLRSQSDFVLIDKYMCGCQNKCLYTIWVLFLLESNSPDIFLCLLAFQVQTYLNCKNYFSYLENSLYVFKIAEFQKEMFPDSINHSIKYLL